MEFKFVNIIDVVIGIYAVYLVIMRSPWGLP